MAGKKEAVKEVITLNEEFKRMNKQIKYLQKLNRQTFQAIESVIQKENLSQGKTNYYFY